MCFIIKKILAVALTRANVKEKSRNKEKKMVYVIWIRPKVVNIKVPLKVCTALIHESFSRYLRRGMD